MVPLPASRVSVGEDPACEVPISPGLGIAPVHFTLEPWEGGHFIQDAGSGSRTLVNGEVTNWRPLVHGDLITAGELTLAYGVTEGEPISFDLPVRQITTRVESVVEPEPVGVDPFPHFTFPGPAEGPASPGPDVLSVPIEEVVSPRVSLGAEDFSLHPAAVPVVASPTAPAAPAAPPGWLPPELATPPPERVVPVVFRAPSPMPEPTRGLPQTSRRRRLALVAGLMALAAGAAAAAVIWKRQHPNPRVDDAPASAETVQADGAVKETLESVPPSAPPAPQKQMPPKPEPPPPILEIRRAL